MATVSFHVEKKDLVGGLVHAPDTLLLRLSGPEAKKADRAALIKGLKMKDSEVEKLYRFEDPLVWFLKPKKEAEARIQNKLFGNEESFFIHVTSLDSRIYISLHWLSANISVGRVREFFKHLAEPGTEIHILYEAMAADTRIGLIEPRKGVELPHYLNITYEGDPKMYRVLVKAPGRRQQCYRCGEDTHWPSQCRSAPTRNLTQETASRPPSSKQSTDKPPADNSGDTLARNKSNVSSSKSALSGLKAAAAPNKSPTATTSPPPLMAQLPTPKKNDKEYAHKSLRKEAPVKEIPEPKPTQEAGSVESPLTEGHSGRPTKRGRDQDTSTSSESLKRANRESTPPLSPSPHMSTSEESASEDSPGSSPGKLVVDLDKDKKKKKSRKTKH